jgi:hypothetical protein
MCPSNYGLGALLPYANCFAHPPHSDSSFGYQPFAQEPFTHQPAPLGVGVAGPSREAFTGAAVTWNEVQKRGIDTFLFPTADLEGISLYLLDQVAFVDDDDDDEDIHVRRRRRAFVGDVMSTLPPMGDIERRWKR